MNAATLTVVVGIVVRHALSGLGVLGMMDPDQTNNLVGAFVTLVGIGMSLYQKRDQLKKKP